MLRKIFICYRRDDAGMAGRIGDSLGVEFGGDGVFLDTDKLVPGHRFEGELLRTLNECDVFIAIIGTQWLASLDQRQQSGQKDYVVEEIKEALRLNLSVIPLLVDGAELPDESQLPGEIGHAMRWHGLHVRHESFHRDVDELGQAIYAIRGSSKPAKKPVAGLITGGILCAALLGGGVWYLQSRVDLNHDSVGVVPGKVDTNTDDKQSADISTGASDAPQVSTPPVNKAPTVTVIKKQAVDDVLSPPEDTQAPAAITPPVEVLPPVATAQPKIALQTSDVPKAVDTGSAHQQPTTAIDVSDNIRWTDGFSIFAEDKFNLCGYTSFTASVADADNVVIVKSADREIPGQTFRGLQWRVKPGAGTALFDGCRVLLDYETLSGTQRIRVRENRGE